MSKFVFFTPHCWNWGGPCLGYSFLARFSDLILGPQDNGFIQERGVVAGTRDGVIIVILIFLAALVAVFLVVLVLFSGAILVAVLCLDKGWILAWSFGVLFFAVLVGAFRCPLGCCFGLCFCVVGGLAPGLVLAWLFQFLLVASFVLLFCI